MPELLVFSSVDAKSGVNPLNFIKTTHSHTYPTIDPKRQDLSGKYVLITGASKGVGKATALSYTKAGVAGLALLARSNLSTVKEEIIAAATAADRPTPKVVAIQADVSKAEDVRAAAEQVTKEFPHLDILVNNAGYQAEWGLIGDSDPDEWWYSWEVNFKGPYLTTRAFIPLLLNGSEKTVLNVASVGANLLNPGASSYMTAKLALVRLSEFISAEYREKGLISFAVHPCVAKTELAYNMPEYMHVCMMDDVEVASDTMVFLTSERRDWLAGRFVICTWDMDEFLCRKDDIVTGDLLKFRLAVEL